MKKKKSPATNLRDSEMNCDITAQKEGSPDVLACDLGFDVEPKGEEERRKRKKGKKKEIKG